MRAIRFHTYGDPSVLQLEEIAEPQPAAEEVLIEVHASSLNPADIGARTGLLRLIHARHLPHTPGYDVAGRVVAIGASVTAFLPGDRVFGMVGLGGGAQAEYAVVAQSKLAIAPQTLSFADAASIPLAGLTALQALREHARLQRGQRVLINGAGGGVGVFAIQVAKLLGCKIGAVCRREQHDLVAELGATTTIDYRDEDVTQRHARWDVVLDAAGSLQFRDVRRVLSPNGVMVSVRPDPRSIGIAALRLVAGGPRYTFFVTRARGQDLGLLSRLIDGGKLRPVVDRVFPIEEIRSAHEYLEGRTGPGKTVIEIRGDVAR
jgi:NADPH:quinone reductase